MACEVIAKICQATINFVTRPGIAPHAGLYPGYSWNHCACKALPSHNLRCFFYQLSQIYRYVLIVYMAVAQNNLPPKLDDYLYNYIRIYIVEWTILQVYWYCTPILSHSVLLLCVALSSIVFKLFQIQSSFRTATLATSIALVLICHTCMFIQPIQILIKNIQNTWCAKRAPVWLYDRSLGSWWAMVCPDSAHVWPASTFS